MVFSDGASTAFLSFALAFSAGIMVTVSLADLLPTAAAAFVGSYGSGKGAVMLLKMCIRDSLNFSISYFDVPFNLNSYFGMSLAKLIKCKNEPDPVALVGRKRGDLDAAIPASRRKRRGLLL